MVVDDTHQGAVEVLHRACVGVTAKMNVVVLAGDERRTVAALAGSPDSVADVLVLAVDEQVKHGGLHLGIEFAEDQFAVRLEGFPVVLEVAGVELKIDHEVFRFQIALREAVLVHVAARIAAVGGSRSRLVVLDDLTKSDMRKSLLLLDAGLDVDQTLLVSVVALRGIDQQVLKNLAGVAVTSIIDSRHSSDVF